MRTLSVLIPAAVLIVFIVSVVLDYNLNFDEGYNLQVPLNLLRYGRYGSETLEGFREFDPLITTGPLVLAPITPVLAVFGVGITQARVVPALYSLVLIALVVGLTWRPYGPSVAAVGLILLLTIKDVFLMLGNVLGETGGLVWWLIGIALLARAEGAGRTCHPIWAGLAFGLAVWAKPSMAVPTLVATAVMAVWAWRVERQYLWTAMSACLTGGLWFVLPVFAGPTNPTLFGADANNLITQQLDGSIITNLLRNIGLGWPTLIGPVLVTGVWLARRSWRERQSVPFLLGLTPAIWMIWWLCLNRDGVMRHLLPAQVLGVFPIAIWVAGAGFRWRRGMVVAAALVILLGVSGSGTGLTDYFSRLQDTRQRRAAQLQLAEEIRSLPDSVRLYGWGWYRAWDLAFLTRRALGDAQTADGLPTDAFLVTTPTIARDFQASADLDSWLSRCPSTAVLDAGFNYRLLLSHHCAAR